MFEGGEDLAEPGSLLRSGLMGGLRGASVTWVADVADAARSFRVGGVAEVLDESVHAAVGGLGEGDHAVDLGTADGDLCLVGGLPLGLAGLVVVGEADVAVHVHESNAGDEELLDGAVEGLAVDRCALLEDRVVKDVYGREFGGKADGYSLEVGGWRVVLFEEELLQSTISKAVEEDGSGRKAIAAGSADLLVIGLNRSG